MKRKQILYLGLDPSRYPHEGILTHLPVIQTVPKPLRGKIRQAFQSLSHFTDVVLTSRTTLPIFFDYATQMKVEQTLSQKRYIVVGQATAALLKQYGHPSLVAADERAEGVVELLKTLSFDNRAIFFPHSAQGRTVITRYLEQHKLHHLSISLYETRAVKIKLPDLHAFDHIVFTSPSTVHAFFALTSPQNYPAPGQCIAIGPITQAALNQKLHMLPIADPG